MNEAMIFRGMRKIVSMLLTFSSVAAFGSAGSIDGLEQIDVNGSKQWLYYIGQNIEKPVVLFVHGGPGSPLMIFSNEFDAAFSKDFVVIHWDQRNSGKSYDPGLPVDRFSLDQVARDGLVVVQHLKKKFSRTQILLVGHSWGSMVGARMTQLSPSDFSAYLSVGTVSDMQAGDALKYAELKQRIFTTGDDEDKADLMKLGLPPWKNFEQIVIQSRLMAKFRGSFYSLNVDQVNSAIKKCTQYSDSDWANLDKAMLTIWHQIEPFLSTYKAISVVPSLQVRTFFLQGRFDLATPTQLAKSYFDEVRAPQGKDWVLFEHSAHFPMYEEPAKFLEVLKRASE